MKRNSIFAVVLALLAIIHQPNPPKLLLLAEPERGIHHRRIDEVIDLIFKLAQEKEIQVIMTTHSPLVLDKFKDIPEAVFVFDKNEEGATEARNLEKDILIPKEEAQEQVGVHPIDYTRSMGSNWLMVFLGSKNSGKAIRNRDKQNLYKGKNKAEVVTNICYKIDVLWLSIYSRSFELFLMQLEQFLKNVS